MHTIRFGGFLEPFTTMPLLGYILVENYYADACLCRRRKHPHDQMNNFELCRKLENVAVAIEQSTQRGGVK